MILTRVTESENGFDVPPDRKGKLNFRQHVAYVHRTLVVLGPLLFNG